MRRPDRSNKMLTLEPPSLDDEEILEQGFATFFKSNLTRPLIPLRILACEISGPRIPCLISDRGCKCFDLNFPLLRSDDSASPNPFMYSTLGSISLKRQSSKEGPTSTQKRQRPKRSKYWFDDGNVILQVENTQFRVHRGMIVHHSVIFKDTFGIPQLECTDKPRVEGCPVVQLEDSLEDVKIMISIFYGKLK